ncbi:thyroid peroxidase-like [Patella vulgata]|uniref:thyroid peroxidase-like n=1 Tax=Patella vulgata TaxID=6465 RepID=UPI0024A7CED5|nr:thyroid peroxidase-like [Patella vulgata]
MHTRQLSDFADECKQFDTTDAIYRTANGRCNNVAQPDWGSAEIPFERLLQNSYEDEYIPEIIGVTGAEQYQLDEGNYTYDPAVNPSIYNSFATAAFRYGHSTIAITNKLFITETGSLDLIALNIQRGRDHGLPSYNDFREHVCGLPRISNFQSRAFRDFGDILADVYE